MMEFINTNCFKVSKCQDWFLQCKNITTQMFGPTIMQWKIENGMNNGQITGQ